MPPKIEKKVEGPHPTAISNARTKLGSVNNALFTKSLQGLKKTSTKNAIVKSYMNTLKRTANEKAAEMAAEVERTGGISLKEEFDKYKKEWEEIPYTQRKDSKTGQLYRVISPAHTLLVKGINDILKDSQGLTISVIETNTPSYYAERAIARDIARGDYDSKLEQLKYVVEKEGPIFIAADHGKNLLAMIANRKYKLAPGGGAGSEGGARRRRTHKRKTHRRKTHKRRH